MAAPLRPEPSSSGAPIRVTDLVGVCMDVSPDRWFGINIEYRRDDKKMKKCQYRTMI
jgi:hypothetical protein